MRGREQILQEQVVNYLSLKYPNILYTASVGGMRTHIGVARKMKRAGYRKGVPDLMIFEPSKDFVGLAIELKTEDGRLSPEQKYWLEALTARKWKAVMCRGFDEAIKTIDDYLKVGG